MVDSQNNRYTVSGDTILIIAIIALLTVFVVSCCVFVQVFSVLKLNSEFNYKLGQLDQRVGIIEEENKRDLDLRAGTYQRKIVERSISHE